MIRGFMHEIEQRWLDQVKADVGGREVDLTALRDGIADYLVHLADYLERGGELEDDGDEHEAWTKTAREHGITRVRLGFDIAQLIHEFDVLRRVLIDTMRSKGGIELELEQVARISDFIGDAIAQAVRAYVASRDYESRRVEAEHIGFVTHELRNPLTNATMAARRLRKHPGDVRALEILDRSHARLRELMDRVLIHESLRAGHVECQPEETTLGQLLEQASAAAHEVAKQKGLTLELRYHPDYKLMVDINLTNSILQNILDNAVKYTDTGTVFVSVDEGEENVVFHVYDNCPGVTDEELSAVFVAFHRGPQQHGKEGTGLGLAIASSAAQAQGGSVAAKSMGKRGCHFWVTLPRRVERCVASPPENEDARPGSQ